jgi:hypothetical protein
MGWNKSVGLVIAFAVIGFSPSRGLAKGFFLITHGDTVSHVASLPENVKAELRKVPGMGSNPSVGYYYSYFGIFWLDFWTWGGKHCLYEGKTVWKDVPVPVIASMLNKSEDQLSRPWNYTFPPGLLILVGIVGIGVLAGFLRKSPEAKVKILLEDPRYQKALEILNEEAKREEAAAAARAKAQSESEALVAGMVPAEAPPGVDKPYAAALNHLINEGIPAQEAKQNLNLILATLAAPPPETPA